jgi:hypothetical protein
LVVAGANAFEKNPRIPGIPGEAFAGEPILGMQWWIERDEGLRTLLRRRNCAWILSPNTSAEGSPDASAAQRHGAFDDDVPTLKATLARIVTTRTGAARAAFQFEATAATWADRREVVMN